MMAADTTGRRGGAGPRRLLENDGVRRALVRWSAARAGRDGFAAAPVAQLDLPRALVVEHLDTGAIASLIERGAPAGPRVLPAGAPPG